MKKEIKHSSEFGRLKSLPSDGGRVWEDKMITDLWKIPRPKIKELSLEQRAYLVRWIRTALANMPKI